MSELLQAPPPLRLNLYNFMINKIIYLISFELFCSYLNVIGVSLDGINKNNRLTS